MLSELLRSCVGEEEWEMYRDLGFIRVWGTMSDGADRSGAAFTISLPIPRGRQTLDAAA